MVVVATAVHTDAATGSFKLITETRCNYERSKPSVSEKEDLDSPSRRGKISRMGWPNPGWS